MRGRRRLAAVTAGLLAVTVAVACTGEVEGAGPNTAPPTLSVVPLPTCSGTEEFDAPAARVAVTEQGVLDTFAALGVAERVAVRIGTASTADPAYAPLFAATPEIGELSPSTEGLLGARPDLVVQVRSFHLDPAQGGADPGAVRAAGMSVYPTRSACAAGLARAPEDTLDGVLTDITNIGALVGVPQRAVELTERLRAQRDDVAARVAGRPRVPGVQLSVVGGQLYATGGGLAADMLEVAGMENLFPDPTQSYVPISPEVLAARNPQVIQIVTFPTDDGAAQIDDLRRTFPSTDAVRHGRIGVMDSRKASPASPSTYQGLAELAHLVHPDAVPASGR